MPNRVDGSTVSNSDALKAWVPIARNLLIETAKSYRSVITYKELALQVQEDSGIATPQLIMHWIGGLLEEVARDAQRRQEPPLTALCVRQNGTIGVGYMAAPRSVPLAEDLDPEEQAAIDRLLCYRAYARDLPADGGVPTLTAQVAERRAERKPVGSRLREINCNECWTIVPSAPNCAHCGAPLATI